MFNPRSAFSGFSVDDLAAAKEFYSSTLGLTVDPDGVGARLHLPGGGTVFMYPKADHQPAAYTMLNFEVEDIDASVDDLVGPRREIRTLRGHAGRRREGDHAWPRTQSGS